MPQNLRGKARSDVPRLSTTDAQALLRTYRELHALPNDRVLRTQKLLESLRALVDAEVAICAQFENYGPEWAIPTHVWGVDQGFTEPQRAAFFASLHDVKDNIHPIIEALRAHANHPTAFKREDLITDDAWYASGFVRKYATAAGVDHLINPIFPLDGNGRCIGCSILRLHGRPRYDEREQALIWALNAELGDFYQSIAAPADRAGAPAAAAPALRPRLRRTLEHLLAGQSEKQVARTLGITRDTVHEYVKQIYKHYGVGSRAELLARVLPATPRPRKRSSSSR